MKNIWKIIFITFMISILSCEKEEEEPEVFQVEVMGKGMDCGDIYLIRFEEQDREHLNKYLNYTNAFFPVFYASNLNAEHKEKGLYLNISVEKIADKEIPGCTAFGPGYGHIWIKSSEIVSDAFP